MNEQIKALQEKIANVQKDIAENSADENSEKKRMVLSDYLDYLRDELRMLEQNDRLRNRPVR